MRKFYSIFALCAFLFLSVSSRAVDYTIPTGSTANSTALPIWMANSAYGSYSQQIYLASELTSAGASAGNITALTFYYTAKASTTAAAMTRPIKIWIMETTKDTIALEEVPWQSGLGADGLAVFNHNGTNKGGTLVYTGDLSTESCSASVTKTVTIDLDSSFPWDGSKNIVLTIGDMSGTSATISSTNLRFVLVATSKPRFVHKRWLSGNSDTRTSWFTDLSDLHGEVYGSSGSGIANQVKVHKYVNKLGFSITPAAVVIPAPTNLAASSITASSATLSWDAVAGATSYNVRWGKTSGSLDNSDVAATNSIDLSGLDDGETYYFDVQTVTAGGTSAFSSEANFNTAAVTHEHNGISFNKWASNSSFPTSGDYYLNADVAFGWSDDDVTLSGNLNLCLNGHTANLAFFRIIVPDGKTFTIFDHVGGGKITSFVPGEIELYENNFQATIVVKNGGTLVLKEGIVENTFARDPDDPSDDDLLSLAIYSNGTIQLAGDAQINSNDADFCLHASNVISLVGALSNVEKHSVYKNGGVFTSGWSTHMSGEDPKDFFVSARADKIVSLKDGEAALRTALNLSESSANAAIGDNYNQTVDVNLTRSLTSSQFNTFCLPFALDNAQLEEFFGAGYDLEEFVSSEIVGDELVLSFNKVTSLEAGKPYLLQPSVDVANPAFEGVTITAIAPADQTSDEFISFHGTFAPTELAGGNKNLLFLGAGNELFWPAATGNLKGFRAYFEVKGAAQKAKAARIVKKEDQTQAIDNIENPNPAQKRILNGQLIIEKNGTFYNAQGQIVK